MIEMSRQRKRLLKVIGLAGFSLALLWVAYNLRSIFNPVLLSLLLAYILNPLANFFERFKVRRSLTIFFIYIILSSILVMIFLFFIPLVGIETSYLYKKTFLGDSYQDVNKNGVCDDKELVRDLDHDGKYNPSYLDVGMVWLKDTIERWNKDHPDYKLEWQLVMGQLGDKESIKEVSRTVFLISKGTIIATLKTILSLFSLLSYVVLLPLYTFFLLRSLNDIRDTIYDHLPGAQKTEIIRVLSRIHVAVSAFFRGKLIICILKGVLTWGILQLMGVKYALIFGAIQMVASIVPFLVLVVGMIPNVILLILDQSVGWPLLIVVVVMYGIIEALEGFLLTPWVMGQETGLHPLTVIISLLVGGKVFGMFGLIIAIPLCTTLKILGQEFLLPAWREVAHCSAKNKKAPPPDDTPKAAEQS